MAKASNLEHTVTIEGLYFCSNAGKTEERPYKETVVMTEEMRQAGILHVWVKYFAPKIMPAKYPGYTSLATHNLVAHVPSDESIAKDDINLMVRSQLLDFIKREQYPIEEGLYKDDGALRQAIADYEENPVAFKERQAHFLKIRGHEIKMEKAVEKALDNIATPAVPNPELEEKLNQPEPAKDLVAAGSAQGPTGRRLTRPAGEPKARPHDDELELDDTEDLDV